MHCLIVSALFPPEPVVSALTSAGLAGALLARGNMVQVLAPYPSRPVGVRYPGYRHRGYKLEKSTEGYEVIRCPSAHSNESKLASRFLENFTFGLSSAWRLLWMKPRPQVIYANTWPLVSTGLLALTARLRRIPLVLSVQDLYPESLAAQGRLKSRGVFFRLLQRWDGWIASRSRAVVVIGESFARVYREQRDVAAERVHVVPNWVDDGQLSEEFERLSGGQNPIRKNLGLTDESFLMVYAGNIGAAAGVESLLQAMSKLTGEPEMHLLVAGSGSRLQACQLLAQALDLRRVHFLSPWDESETALVLSAADLLLLPTQGEQSLASIPSKLAYYLLSARPVLACAAPGTEVAEVMEQSGSGWLIVPGDIAGIAAGMRVAKQTPLSERIRCGAAGQAYAREHYSRHGCLSSLVELVEKAVLVK